MIKETEDEIRHLESIKISLDMAADEHDLNELKRELMEFGYIKKKSAVKKPTPKDRTGKNIKGKPLHYISSDGYHMYVGKNNYQNEELTFKLANGNDWWFHAKNLPGSHVIVKSDGENEPPDRTFEEAAKLAAYYSGAKNADKVEIDYTTRKNIKKPSGKAPGFVIYNTNYSIVVNTDITDIKRIDD